MKKLIIIILVGFVILAGARQLLLPKMVERGYEKLTLENVGVDRAAELADGLHVYICGAGSPLPDPKRSGPCIGVLAGDQAFIFDTGTGGARNLGPMGFPVGRIETIFLTHLHSDHLDGLGEMLLGRWINGGRSEPTPVRGPHGTAKIVDGFNMAYQLDSTYRTAHHGEVIANPSGFGGKGSEIEMTDDSVTVFEQGGVKITAFRVSHEPVSPAFGYRVDYKDRSISISGDTAYDLNVAKASEGVDVLLHEALNMEMVKTLENSAKANGADRLAQIFNDIRDYHTSPVDAAKTAKAAQAQALVLYHIVPMLPNDALIPLFVKGADAHFDRRITVSEDGTIIRLPSASEDIIYEYGL
ncbi:MBL fold metallo-hydrolase [Hellea balneolensis]|uniref:MBL fold metallo-hydrolase n=1 Tax=Hellea balneolensis TaxID=287478 RepID=UPI000410D88D|nr:MBL fold metallo-hydrolase [Hellea balneolensis]